MKKILLILVIATTVFLIYLFNIDNKIYYLSINSYTGNEENSNYNENVENYLLSNKKLETSINDFSKDNYLISDLINDIKNNKKITVNNKNTTLKNALIKADLFTLFIGMNELNNNTLSFSNSLKKYTFVDSVLADLDNLLSLIREYCKEDIFIIGVYYPNTEYNKELADLYSYYNDGYKKLADNYNMKYIDLYNVFLENPEYLSSTEVFVPSLKGYKYISEQIIITIGETVLKNSWFSKKNLLYYISIKFL